MRAPEDDVQKRLERALEALPIAVVCRPDAISYKAAIPGIARRLTLFARRDLDRAAYAAARKELLRAGGNAKALAEQLGKLPFTATAAVGVPSATLQANLTDFADRAARALPANRRGGQSKSAVRVAEYLYQEFSRLTGKEPTRSVGWEDGKEVSAFCRLMKDVFDELGIDASPETMARKVIKGHRRVIGKRGVE
jgi:hypothetical protein